jgi:hypothetical protein
MRPAGADAIARFCRARQRLDEDRLAHADEDREARQRLQALRQHVGRELQRLGVRSLRVSGPEDPTGELYVRVQPTGVVRLDVATGLEVVRAALHGAEFDKSLLWSMERRTAHACRLVRRAWRDEQDRQRRAGGRVHTTVTSRPPRARPPAGAARRRAGTGSGTTSSACVTLLDGASETIDGASETLDDQLSDSESDAASARAGEADAAAPDRSRSGSGPGHVVADDDQDASLTDAVSATVRHAAREFAVTTHEDRRRRRVRSESVAPSRADRGALRPVVLAHLREHVAGDDVQHVVMRSSTGQGEHHVTLQRRVRTPSSMTIGALCDVVRAAVESADGRGARAIMDGVVARLADPSSVLRDREALVVRRVSQGS